MPGNNLSSIQMVLLDVDGVLTDGRIIYGDSGEEIKPFHVKDGFGIRMLMDAGLQVGIVTGRRSEALMHRCRNLGITLVFDGIRNKAAALEEICRATGCPADQVAFIGDDLPDIPIMTRVGYAVAVADAHEVVMRHADMVTRAPGGQGAVREFCELLLNARGLWEDILSRYSG